MMLIRKGTGEDPRLIEKDKVPYLEFEALKKQSWLTHAFSTRLGGVSSGCFASMNLGFGRGEEDKIVAENYKRLGDAVEKSGLVPSDSHYKCTPCDRKRCRKGNGKRTRLHRCGWINYK